MTSSNGVAAAKKHVKKEILQHARIEDVGNPNYVYKSRIGAGALKKILFEDEYQFASTADRQAIADSVRDLFDSPGTRRLGIRRGWADIDTETHENILESYVNLSAEKFRERKDALQEKLAIYISKDRFDELALLQTLRKPEAQELPPELKQELATFVLSSPQRPLTLDTQKVLSDYGFNGEKEAAIQEINRWTRDLPRLGEYPVDELDALYSQVQAAFSHAIPENQDEIISALAAFEAVLNSKDVLKRFGVSEGGKVYAPISMLESFRAARSSQQSAPTPAAAVAAEPGPINSQDAWSVR
jgi:hypothetical protein